MTLQDTFDAVVNGLRKQEAFSVTKDGDCLYRSLDGFKCAAGMLIEDKDYKQVWEGADVREPSLKKYLVDRGHNIDLVAALQSTHDFYACDGGFSGMEKTWEAIAVEYGLIYTPQAAAA